MLCPTQDMVMSLAPGLLNLVPVVWLVSRNSEVRWAAVSATWLGALRLAAPAFIYLSYGPLVPIDRLFSIPPFESLLASDVLYVLSLACSIVARGPSLHVPIPVLRSRSERQRTTSLVIPAAWLIHGAALLVVVLSPAWRVPVVGSGPFLWGGVPSAQERLQIGERKWERGDYQDALRDLSAALDARPGWSQALNLRALVRVSAGDLDGALGDAQSAVSAEPSYLYLDTRAFVYFKLGRYHEAVADYDQVLSQRPRLPESLLGRGTVLFRLGDEVGARRDLWAGVPAGCNAEKNPQLTDLLRWAYEPLSKVSSFGDRLGTVGASPAPPQAGELHWYETCKLRAAVRGF